MADYLARAIGGGGNIRAFAAVTTDLTNEARRRHDTWPTATAALGRALTATAMLSATLKDPQESITLRVAGDGPLGGIICDADEQGRVRGYVRNPHVDLDALEGKFNVGAAVGRGHLYVTRHLALEGIYTGTSELVSGELGDDLAYYLTTSEQTPSAVGLGVRIAPDGTVVASGGYLLQLLPATSEEEREQLEVNIRALGQVSRAVEEGLTPEEILGSLMAGLEFKVTETRPLRFQCRCNRQKALDVILTIDPEELELMIRESQGAEMTCQFCGEVYRFTEEEVRTALAEREEGAAQD